jgi:hypothetical protein
MYKKQDTRYLKTVAGKAPFNTHHFLLYFVSITVLPNDIFPSTVLIKIYDEALPAVCPCLAIPHIYKGKVHPEGPERE